jgi:hypothetical protein
LESFFPLLILGIKDGNMNEIRYNKFLSNTDGQSDEENGQSVGTWLIEESSVGFSLKRKVSCVSSTNVEVYSFCTTVELSFAIDKFWQIVTFF